MAVATNRTPSITKEQAAKLIKHATKAAKELGIMAAPKKAA